MDCTITNGGGYVVRPPARTHRKGVPMHPLEALADGIMQFEGWKVASRSWRNRNPGNLRPARPEQEADPEGYRTFTTLAEGWTALLSDLVAKFAGSHGLTLDSTIVDLLNVYAPAGDNNNPGQYARYVALHVEGILGRVIEPTTTLRDLLGGVVPSIVGATPPPPTVGA